jgi:hypothetical protein
MCNNQIKGAVMMRTIFMGIATAFAIASDDLTLFFFGNNSLKQGEKSKSLPLHPQ